MVFLSHVMPGDKALFAQAHVPPGVANLIIAIAAGGAFGVDLFFALSSFLITTLLLRERNAYGSLDVKSFYVRRVLRIWPLYFAFLLIVLPLLHHAVPADSMPLKFILAFVLLSGNWAFVLWGYPHSAAVPLWSISIEEQFYLCWPLIMRRWINHLAVVASVLLVVSFMTRIGLVLHGAAHPQLWCNTLARLDPIACGALLAVHAERKDIHVSLWNRVMLLLFGCAVLTVAGHYEDFAGTKELITFPVVSVACVALILGALGSKLPSARSPRAVVQVLVYLGRISYGLYVFHLMFIEVFGALSAHTLMARAARTMAALLATIAVAAVSYHFFERPFLRLKEKFARVASRPV
jgi:peptidoglycan/LPS O-acetylase OafA/YrhL